MNICSEDNYYRQDAENAKVNQNAKSQGVEGAMVFKNLCETLRSLACLAVKLNSVAKLKVQLTSGMDMALPGGMK